MPRNRSVTRQLNTTGGEAEEGVLLRARLLGEVRFEMAGEELELPTKAKALLAYLALERRLHRREALAELLWPQSRSEDVTASLRKVLLQLRRVLGGALQSDRQHVGLAEGVRLELDCSRFEALIQDGQLEQAMELYRGPFLDGLALDALPFEEWQLAERERLRALAVAALDELVERHERAHDRPKLVRAAARLIDLEPWRETTHRLLMRHYATAGQFGSALAQYERCRRLLEHEFGLPPSPATLKLLGRIRALRERPPPPLPRPAWPLVGRQEELNEAEALLRDPTCRLLSLLGPGGSGKTHVALELARRLAERFLEGASFVPLASVTSHDGVLRALASALALPAPLDPIAALEPQERLVVLDNFEQLVPAGLGVVTDLLERAPGVRLLVTSRERLGLHHERSLTLGGLPTPPEHDLLALTPSPYDDPSKKGANDAAPHHYAAVQLIVQQLGPHAKGLDLPAIHRLCRRLEGLPLALVLAASWLRAGPAQALEAALERDPFTLRHDAADLPERHRSIRAAFAASLERLSAAERRLFIDLAVFQGDFSHEAAGAILGASAEALAGLVDKSLLTLTPQGRYERHALLRTFADERLRAEPTRRAQLHAAHAHFFLSALAAAEEPLKHRQQPRVLPELLGMMEDCRTAWRYALEQGLHDLLDAALEPLFFLYELCGWYPEALETFEALERASTARGWRRLEQRARLRRGWYLFRTGQFEAGQALLTAAHDLFEEDAPSDELAYGHLFQGAILFGQGSFERARAAFQRSYATYEVLGNGWGMAGNLTNLAEVALATGEASDAEALLERGFALACEVGDQHLQARNRFTLGELLQRQGHAEKAEALLGQALELAERTHMTQLQAQAHRRLAELCQRRAGMVEARRHYYQSLERYVQLGEVAEAEAVRSALDALISRSGVRFR